MIGWFEKTPENRRKNYFDGGQYAKKDGLYFHESFSKYCKTKDRPHLRVLGGFSTLDECLEALYWEAYKDHLEDLKNKIAEEGRIVV